MKGNVDNLVTLCLDQIDGDRLALRRKIEESLGRLEKETLISRNGENYFFLTNEERDINKEIKAVDLSSGEEAKLLGEIIFEDVLKGQRKHRFSANKMDFDFNRRCDQLPHRQPEGRGAARLGHHAAGRRLRDLREGQVRSSKARAEGGFVLIRLGNDESLGRELRTYLQTEKYLSHKNDGTLLESTKRILRDCAEDNRQRRERLTTLLGEMLAEAEYFVAGQPLKLKATTPWAALDEAMEYLIQNTFSKMSYLKRLTAEPLKEVQAVLRSNDIAKETAAVPDGREQSRRPSRTCATTSNSARMAKPAGRPARHDREAVLPAALRLAGRRSAAAVGPALVLGEINLMMDCDACAASTRCTRRSPRRRSAARSSSSSGTRPTPRRSRTPAAWAKTLFAEMGPDGEDGLFAFLQTKLKDWQTSLNGYKPLADTGNYPGKEEIADGLTLINKLLADKDSIKFIERFNTLKNRPARFRRAVSRPGTLLRSPEADLGKAPQGARAFQLNRLELERDAQAGPALKRMQEILSAPSPYGLIKEADGLIDTVSAVNSSLLTERRSRPSRRSTATIATLTKDMAAVQGEASLRAACLKPLEALREQVQQEESLAHITQAEAEAVKEFDAAVARIEEFVRKQAEQPEPRTTDRAKCTAAGGQEAADRQAGRDREDDVPGNARRRERFPRRPAAGA